MRSSTFSRALFLFALLGLVAVGCDNSPTSVDDFDVQPDVEVSASSLSLVLTGAESATDFQVSYQGLESVPTAEGTGILSLEKAQESGSPQNGEQVWSVGTSEPVSGIVQESVVVRSQTQDEEITDTLSVTVSPFSVTSDFSAGFAAVADYEDAQRDSSGTGGTTITLQANESNNPTGSTGTNYLEVNASGSGAAVFERRASAPNSDRFTFLIRQAETAFDLTLTFTEETGSGTTDHQITVPVNAGSQWVKYGIAFSQIGENFNPVAQRAGGNGPLTKVEFSADADVTYAIDELMLGTADASQVEIMDFERTTLEYSCITLGTSSDVAASSDGFTARSVEGSGCFGYNYSLLFPNVEGSDVLSLRANASEGDSLYVFVETPSGEGEFNYGNGIQVGLPSGEWGTVEIRIDSLGTTPSALQSAGISNVGFEARGNNPDFMIDDIKLRSSSEN